MNIFVDAMQNGIIREKANLRFYVFANINGPNTVPFLWFPFDKVGTS